MIVTLGVGFEQVMESELVDIVVGGITVFELTVIVALPTQPFTVLVIATEYVPPELIVGF